MLFGVSSEFVMVELTLLAEMFPDVADHALCRWWNEGSIVISRDTRICP